MTLDEIFEERQKLMELLIRDCADLNEQWGIEVLSVAIEELWLEDEKLQDMMDERKKYEIIGDAAQLRETHEAEMRQMIIKAEEEAKTMQAKAKDEARIIAQRTQQDIALMQQELVKLQAQIDIMSVEAQSKAKVMIADAQAQRKKAIDEVTDSKILIHEFIKMLPILIEQVSFEDTQKFTLVPSKKQGLLTAGIFGMQTEKKEEEEE
jgi:regulator of protease activity HflC (stomatin/prohibitin superfamily)